MNWLIQQWYSPRSFLTYLLTPFSAIYRLIISIRYGLYRYKIFKTHQFSVPIIVVGNITVGGTGKTPLVIWLAEFLQQRGYRPGIVSRGYGGRAKHYPYFVVPGSDPIIVSDEAALIAQKTRCPMMIAPNRSAAVKQLLEKTDCNIIISDDGLQHYALARNMEIAVIDGERRLGNEFCLPAGPLREPKKRLQQVDFIVTNGTPQAKEFFMQLRPQPIYNLLQPNLHLDHDLIQQQFVHAVAGIGNPQRFFATLRQLGFNIIEHAFPDHYRFQPQDLDFSENSIIIMTEKDAIKCQRFARNNFWCLPVIAEIDPALASQLLQRLPKSSV